MRLVSNGNSDGCPCAEIIPGFTIGLKIGDIGSGKGYGAKQQQDNDECLGKQSAHGIPRGKAEEWRLQSVLQPQGIKSVKQLVLSNIDDNPAEITDQG